MVATNNRGHEVPDNLKASAGSAVVFMKEQRKDTLNVRNPEWERWFYCENWKGRPGFHSVTYIPESVRPHGACFIDYKRQCFLVFTKIGKLEFEFEIPIWSSN